MPSRLWEGRKRKFIGRVRPIRTPVWISLLASLMTSGVRRFRVPSWSSGPYSPHAEYGGSDGFNGSWENEGRGIVERDRVLIDLSDEVEGDGAESWHWRILISRFCSPDCWSLWILRFLLCRGYSHSSVYSVQKWLGDMRGVRSERGSIPRSSSFTPPYLVQYPILTQVEWQILYGQGRS